MEGYEKGNDIMMTMFPMPGGFIPIFTPEGLSKFPEPSNC